MQVLGFCGRNVFWVFRVFFVPPACAVGVSLDLLFGSSVPSFVWEV